MIDKVAVLNTLAESLDQNVANSVGAIIYAALQAADPIQAVAKKLERRGASLCVGEHNINLNNFRRVYLISFGKAALSMAIGAINVIEDRLTGGVVISKHVHPESVTSLPDCIRIFQGEHPVPGEGSLNGTRAALSLLKQSRKDDLVLCMISGGGSALLTCPVEEISLDDLQELTHQLLICGAEIGEINALRKHLDLAKGGGLARMAQPARLITLILSDVVGSPLDVIASGPTVADPTTFSDARRIIERYHLEHRIPVSILTVLDAGVRGDRPETPKAVDGYFSEVQNILVASNYQAVSAAVEAAQAEGFNSLLLTTYLEGEAWLAGKMLAGVLRQMAETGQPIGRPACLVAGGETTVTIKGDGHGGRNLEVALGAVTGLSGLNRVALITLATDGEDGPTDCAGALISGDTLRKASELGLKMEAHLRRNDSYHFFKPLGALLKPGPTGTNVNDIVFLFAF